MPHSHHSHSGQFCRHAKDQLEDVVKEAIRQGFELFGLSEHAPRYRLQDLFPEESDLTPGQLLDIYLAFLVEATRLRAKYADEIDLLIGLECDYISTLDLDQTVNLLETHPEIDYIVGSVHHVHGVSIDFDRSTWRRAIRSVASGSHSSTMAVDPTTQAVSFPEFSIQVEPRREDIRQFLLAYFDAQYEMIKCHEPEVVGHFDLCLLWTPDISLKDVEGVWEKVERNVRYAVGYGALFEANAAAIRKGWTTSYPNPDVLQLILCLGGRICLSDDSHGVSYVGLNYLKMKDYLVSQGVTDIWHLVPTSSSQPGDVDIGRRNRVRARKVAANWTSLPFWAHLAQAQAQTPAQAGRNPS